MTRVRMVENKRFKSPKSSIKIVNFHIMYWNIGFILLAAFKIVINTTFLHVNRQDKLSLTAGLFYLKS